MYAAGLDIGTTGCKIAVYNEKSECMKVYYQEYPVTHTGGNHEIDFDSIKQAVLNGKYNLKYINAILHNWEKNIITTIQEAQQQEKKYKTNVPSWFDQEIESEEMTEEEEKAFRERLNI